jgi:hypothetical protein
MNTTTSRGRRAARAAAIASTAAFIFGAAACGTETASNDVAPAAPAAAPQAQPSAHPPTSADSAEQRGQATSPGYIQSPSGRQVTP